MGEQFKVRVLEGDMAWGELEYNMDESGLWDVPVVLSVYDPSGGGKAGVRRWLSVRAAASPACKCC